MSSSSSDASNAHEQDESTRGSRSVVLDHTWKSVKPRTTFLLKGGANAEDLGQQVTLGVDTRFQAVYTGLARRLGLRPSDIRLYYCGKLLAHNETPFKMGFIEDDVVFVYEKDCMTPIIIKSPTEAQPNPSIPFCVRSMETMEVLDQFMLPLTTSVELLFMLWAGRRGADPDPSLVTMYVDHTEMSIGVSIGEAGVYEGAYLYGALKSESKDMLAKKRKLVK